MEMFFSGGIARSKVESEGNFWTYICSRLAP